MSGIIFIKESKRGRGREREISCSSIEFPSPRAIVYDLFFGIFTPLVARRKLHDTPTPYTRCKYKEKIRGTTIFPL